MTEHKIPTLDYEEGWLEKELAAAGFYLDPGGRVYQDALKRVGEIR